MLPVAKSVPSHIEGAALVLALDAAAAIVVRSFDAHEISTILLKGPAIRHWLYPDDPAGRTYTDVDLLVSPSQFIAAERVLKDLGYRRPLGAYRDRTYTWELGSTWVHPTAAAPISIDLHRGFHGVRDWETFWTVMDADTTVIEVAGAPVRIPAAAGCALISALHASASSGTEHSAADLKRGSGGLGEEVWREAAGRAEDVGALPWFMLGLSRHEEGRLLLDTLQIASDLPADEATFFWSPSTPTPTASRAHCGSSICGLPLRDHGTGPGS